MPTGSAAPVPSSRTASSAIACAASTSPSGTSTQNSSPPMRLTTASGWDADASVRAVATRTITRSPASCPAASLTAFSPSMSHRRSAGEPGPAGESQLLSSVSSSTRRLWSPVSGSV
jgi:hypothetical protein